MKSLLRRKLKFKLLKMRLEKLKKPSRMLRKKDRELLRLRQLLRMRFKLPKLRLK